MQDKRVVVGLLAIAVCGVGIYYLLAGNDAVAQAVEPERTQAPESNFLNDIVSDSMSAIGLGEPLGIRNNNPLNLRWYSTINWQGQTGSNKGFCVFDKVENGIRAAARTLDNYSAQGYNTIEKIINRWAPAVENNVEAYIASVCASSGFNRSQVIYKSRGDYLPLLAAMIKHENGKQPYSTSTILAGINEA